MHGKVKFFDTKKGFGFLTVEGQKDVFVHYTNINPKGNSNRRDLTEGATVEFDIVNSDRGVQAQNVVEL